MQEKDYNFLKRFWIYQSERFPFFSYGLMVFSFAFSAMSYSKILRGDTEFSIMALIIGTMTSFGYFFLLRLFDEFKDAEDDAKYRPYRAVPRGLISFKELKTSLTRVNSLTLLDQTRLLFISICNAVILQVVNTYFDTVFGLVALKGISIETFKLFFSKTLIILFNKSLSLTFLKLSVPMFISSLRFCDS